MSNIRATFSINAAGTVWGAIDGDISNQTDLQDALNLKADKSELETDIEEVNTAISNLSDTVSSNYNTLDDKIDTEISNRVTADEDLQDNIDTLGDTVADNYTELNNKILDNTADITTNTGLITNINSKIPEQASAVNQLADKNFVNSSIATNTANFIGTFNSIEELEAYSGTLTNNDYAFVATTDSVGNTLYDRYKWNGSEWLFEYELNNSSFTANQWASINSGITDTLTAQITTNQNSITNIQNNYVPKTRTINGKALNTNITLNASDVNALANTTTINDLTTTAQQNVLNSGATSAKIEQITINTNNITTNTNDISTINDEIPYKANKDLSNLTNLGDGVNRAVKGYNEDGNLIYDKELVQDVTKCAHSTFDRSKFTVVGSPKITDDGIASGFSRDNYITVSTNIDNNASKVEVFFEVDAETATVTNHDVVLSQSLTNHPIQLNTNNNTCKFGMYTTSWTLGNTIYNANDTIQGKFEYNITTQKCTLYSRLKGATNWIKEISFTSATNPIGGTFYLGRNATNGNEYYGSNHNLKQFSITVNGVPVFSGNVTGIDTIKPDDYAVVGTPTISTDGVASGFTAQTDYITATFNSITPIKSLEICTRVRVAAVSGNQGTILALYNNLRIEQNNAGIYVKGDIVGTTVVKTVTDLVVGDIIDIYTKIEPTGVYLKLTKGTTNYEITSTQSITFAAEAGVHIGVFYTNNNYPFSGSIDLNATKIVVDGDLVCQPCLKIPCTESAYKHGSKIVDMQYLPRVKDAYEQGYPNRYYALQEDYRLNCSVVGTPTIVGTQVSGFSNTSYLRQYFQNLSGKTLKIQNRFLYDSTIDGCISHGVGTNNSPRLTAFATNQNLEFYFRGTSDVTFTVPYSNFTANTWYNTEAIITPTKQIFQVTDDNGNVVFKETKSTTQTFDIQAQMATYTIGYRSSTSYFSGTVDLAGFKIFVDGDFVGSPVVAPCVALPMGDIYGEIENLKDLKSDLDRISQTKALATGNVANYEEEFKEIQERAHSTFDSSKFTVVGSPVITSDGIASGFSVNNVVKLAGYWNIGTYDSWMFKGEFTTEDLSNLSGNQVIIGINANYAKIFAMNQYKQLILELNTTNSSNWDICDRNNAKSTQTLNSYTKYYYRFYFTGMAYKVDISTDKRTWINYITVNSTLKIYSTSTTEVYVGNSNLQYAIFTGSMNLKEFSFTANGVPVLSGNKTGIDTIKPDDYTVVGTPTISADGVASGFSIQNYFSTNALSNITNQSKIKILAKFSLNDLTTASSSIFGRESSLRIVYSATNQRIECRYVSSNTTWANSLLYIPANVLTVQANKYYYVGFEYDGTKTILSYSLNGKNWINYSIREESTGISAISSLLLGLNTSSSGGIPLLGKLDLNAFKIYIDGNLVYQPCLKIPYTESKTGSKIVNAIYRGRVNDMASQFGYANYYTLSDTDFTLPQVELYGLIGDKTLRDSYYNGVTYWELFSNRRLEQGGSCESGVEYTLPKPFADANYVLTIPYSSKTATSFIPSATGDFIAKGTGLL